jgi:hypothetical protein
MWMHHEGRRRTKDLRGKRPKYLRKKTATAIGIRGCKSGHRSPLGSKRTQKKTLSEIVSMKIAKQIAETFKKTTGMKITKQIIRSSVWLLPMKTWTLWKGQSPPKRMKSLLA